MFVFCKYNSVAFNIDFYRVRTSYIHFEAHFLGDYNAAKFVNVAYYTGGFQFRVYLS